MRERVLTGLAFAAWVAIGTLFAALPVMAQAAPTVSISVTTGNVPKIDWACQAGSTSATATATPATSSWTGAKPLTGSATAAPITDTQSYVITCTTAGKDYVDLSWTAPAQNTDGTALTDLAGYEVWSGASASSMTLEKTLAANVTAYRSTGLSPGVRYFYVKAFNAAAARSAASATGSATATAAQTASAGATLKVPNTATGLAVN